MTNFPSLTKGISWVDSTVDPNGNPLPQGEVLASTTLGIRADGDTAFGPGNYKWIVPVAAPASSETLAALNAALGKNLPPGNYWLNAQQTDTLNGQSSTSNWGATETPFSIPVPIVQPGPPQQVQVS